MAPGLIGLSPQSRWSEDGEGSRIEVGAAGAEARVLAQDMGEKKFQLGQVGNGIHVAAMKLHPGCPGGTENKEVLESRGTDLGHGRGEVLEGAIQGGADGCLFGAEGAPGVVIGAIRQPRPAIGIIQRRITTFEMNSSAQSPVMIATIARGLLGRGPGAPVQVAALYRVDYCVVPLNCGPPKRTHLDRGTRTTPEVDGSSVSRRPGRRSLRRTF